MKSSRTPGRSPIQVVVLHLCVPIKSSQAYLFSSGPCCYLIGWHAASRLTRTFVKSGSPFMLFSL
jgi:hypothetical protein